MTPQTRAIVVALSGFLTTGTLFAQFTQRAQADALPDAPSAILLPPSNTLSVSTASAGEPFEMASFHFPAPPDSSAAPELLQGQTDSRTPAAKQSPAQTPADVSYCPTGLLANFMFMSQKQRAACQQQDPLQFIVEPGPIKPLTPRQKALLAGRGVVEPFNLITIVAFSGISVAANAHSAYGPGFHGWGLLIGYSLVEDIQGETTGTFLIPTLAHEDPRYHRLPGHPFGQRLLHAISHTVLSQHDDGTIMPNYATLINYPLSAEISNLYVPGVATNAPSTAKRIALGYATDPVGAIVAEFLPDVAKRVHFHILFAQQILNQIALGQPTAQQ